MTAVAEPAAGEHKQVIADRIVDGVRRAAHASHQARLLKSIAEDAVEDGVHAARRAMKTVRYRLDDLGDLRDEAARCVKRQPLVAVGTAFGAGLAIGAIAAWAVRRGRRSE